MKTIAALTIVIGVVLVIFGSPFVVQDAALAHYYGAPRPILPMTFAHVDHVTVSCMDCHHNYVDDTGDTQCMNCHVTDSSVWPLFEEQFHDLCRDCHTERAANLEEGGPPRQCKGCHLEDQLP